MGYARNLYILTFSGILLENSAGLAKNTQLRGIHSPERGAAATKIQMG